MGQMTVPCFAVAFAEALCAGKDPHLLTFDHDATKVASHKGEDVQKRSCVLQVSATMGRVVRNLGAWYSVPNARNGTTNSA